MRTSGQRVIVFAAALATVLSGEAEMTRGASAPDSVREPMPSAAMLVYSSGEKTGRCFGEGFLELARRETTVRIGSRFVPVALVSDELGLFPFAVLSGEGAFELTEQEVEELREYLLGGGFLLASAGCSDHAWATSLERAAERAFPESALTELPLDHPLFHTVFDVKELVSRRRQPVRIMGLEVGGRLAMIYSPQGLNDTRNIGPATAGECCCCGGDEVVAARHLNVNALVFALLP